MKNKQGKVLKTFIVIGYDDRFQEEFETCKKSILDNCKHPETLQFEGINATTAARIYGFKRRHTYKKSGQTGYYSWHNGNTSLTNQYQLIKNLAPYLWYRRDKGSYHNYLVYIDATHIFQEGADIIDLVDYVEEQRNKVLAGYPPSVWVPKTEDNRWGLDNTMYILHMSSENTKFNDLDRLNKSLPKFINRWGTLNRNHTLRERMMGEIPIEWSYDPEVYGPIDWKNPPKVINFYTHGSPIRARLEPSRTKINLTYDSKWWDIYYYYVTEVLIKELQSK